MLTAGLNPLRVDAANDRFERFNLPEERAPTGAGARDPGARPTPVDHLVDLHQAGLLENTQVLREVPAGQSQGLEQVVEVHSTCLVDDREDAEAHALMDEVVDAQDGILGLGARHTTHAHAGG